MDLDTSIGVGQIVETGELMLIFGPVEITLTQEQARIIRDGLCSRIGIPVAEEVEVFEESSIHISEQREGN